MVECMIELHSKADSGERYMEGLSGKSVAATQSRSQILQGSGGEGRDGNI